MEITDNCHTCGNPFAPSGIGTGYGTDARGHKHCYACCDAKQRTEIDFRNWLRDLTPRTAWDFVGGLSNPSKMPGYGYGIPAARCQTGAKLAETPGSVCAKCYALRGNYRFANVQASLEKRFASLTDPRWVAAMIRAVGHYEKSGFFRWHDSGDIQSVRHLAQICQVAEGTPDVRHWLPTREFLYVSEYLRLGGKVPANLTIRLSALMVNGPAPVGLAKRLGLNTSGVSSDGSFTCPASAQGNKCLDCRACWDRSVPNVAYKLH